jgi:hypothetical protein
MIKDYDKYLRCKICGSQYNSQQQILSHIKSHQQTAEKYFPLNFNKKDLHTGELIKYKSFEQYFLVDFIDKRNMKQWLQSVDKRVACDYLKSKLETYCRIKQLTKAPTQSELKTISCLPKADTFMYVCEQEFSEICRSLGLKNNFNYSVKHTQQDFTKYTGDEIVVDTREQQPLKFKGLNIINSKLECGDYAKSTESKVVVERKSLGDFYSTLSGGFERFKREMARAAEMGIYIVVVTECQLKTVLYAKRRFGACSGDYIMHHMRQLCREFDNIQFVFADGKAEASKKTLFILEMNELVRNIDIEYWFEQEGFSWL